MGRRFETSLKPPKAKWVGGYKSGAINPGEIADEVMGQVDGPWLTCYMIRRFGWPNFGSDDYKELCSWSLVTPLPGLWMTVTPFLGGGSNLHFGVLFDAETGRELERDPGRESFWRRRERAIRAWWKQTGSKLYALGTGDASAGDELVRHGNHEEGGKVWGLWKRPSAMKKVQALADDSMLFWWLAEFIADKHPEVDVPRQLNERELKCRESAFMRRAKAAIAATMRDLLRPVSVRDIGFSVLGRDEGMGPGAPRFEGAGCTPEYWYSAKAKRARCQMTRMKKIR